MIVYFLPIKNMMKFEWFGRIFEQFGGISASRQVNVDMSN